MTQVIKIEVPVVIEKDGNEYHAFAPQMKGLHTCGRTVQETMKNAKNAVEAYLTSLIKHGENLPFNLIDEGDFKKIVKSRIKSLVAEISLPIPA